ncbi:RNA-binding protein required for biogenesis of the ribosomal 60S subunit [Phaffia rhodozyma]|uniref:RNA-binding protein required for biogenesis of the ribosomal 60S subunit n=1 Tax=Phaffia rhodozyma TaxID=264483 RepID=A0A0F7SMI9_PHARH|nr:RNA-binding protein required for biogenesis of the ribosomal 60S subunit [Phaffia rhodozyma]
MASLHKSANKISASQKQKRKASEGADEEDWEDDSVAALPAASSTSTGGKVVKRRKDKVLMLSSRGVTQRMRHLMGDLEVLLPHVKKDAKLDSKNSLHLVNELADLHSCNNALYFEARRHEDLYMWASKTPNGPSIKFHVLNIHTMDELKMTGNCLKGSRGIVSFDGGWDSSEESKLMREVLTHIFSVPKSSRKTKPFIDHVLTFSLLDNKIWFRNYQIVEKDPMVPNGPPQTSLVEIGPRFVLTPIRIFEGSFSGATVYENAEFVTPAAIRAASNRELGTKYKDRKDAQRDAEGRREVRRLDEDQLGVTKVFA